MVALLLQRRVGRPNPVARRPDPVAGRPGWPGLAVALLLVVDSVSDYGGDPWMGSTGPWVGSLGLSTGFLFLFGFLFDLLRLVTNRLG